MNSLGRFLIGVTAAWALVASTMVNAAGTEGLTFKRQGTESVAVGVTAGSMAYREASTQQDPPSIELTEIPPYGSWNAYLRGRVRNVDPTQFKVACYIRVGGGIWTKPYRSQPLTDLDASGNFSCLVTTGGIDEQAVELYAYLLPVGYTPPLMSGQSVSPPELEQHATAKAVASRTPTQRRIQFSGYDWTVKTSRIPVGPGPNLFSDSESSVLVDDSGRLHLKISRRDNQWYAAEVVATRTFGYGRYSFRLSSTVDSLDPNVVLGLFTWSDSPDFAHRELDIEISRWSDALNPSNAQFVVQPYDRPGNMKRFAAQVPEDSIASFRWEPDRVVFEMRNATGDVVQAWTYSGDIPKPGDENPRINLWLYNSRPPSDGKEVEVIIKSFAFEPLTPTAPSGASPRPIASTPAVVLEPCRFVLGFKTLRDLIPDTVGDCLTNEGFNPQNGDSLQKTTRGLLVWRKADNWTAFTDGSRTWINGPFGLQERGNHEKFPWEAVTAPAVPAATWTPTPTAAATATRSAIPTAIPTSAPTATPVPTPTLPGGPGQPAISFTHIPPYGSRGDFLRGRVLHVTPSDHKVAVYICVLGGWWTKPYWAAPLTSIGSDGYWAANVTTGGRDNEFTKVVAYLIPNGYNPPLMSGGAVLPAALDQMSAAKAEATRSP